METLLKVTGLEKSYGKGEALVKALRGIDLDIYPGQLTAIFGKSGSGKTTLLKVLGLLSNADKGTITFHDQNILGLKGETKAKIRREEYGFIFQDFNLIPEYKVKDNILMPLYLDNTKIDQDYFEYLLKRIEIKEIIERYPDQISGGQQQRCAIARALISKPKLIFADEPTGNLDKQTGKNIFDLMIDLVHKDKQTIVMVTHDLELASKSDRIITLSDGIILKDNDHDFHRFKVENN